MNVSTESRRLLCIAGVSLFLATTAGAVGSHVLAVDERTLHSFETAVEFQFFHSLGLIGAVLTAERLGANLALRAAAWLLVAGTLLFCASIYAATFGAPRGVLALAPYGGVALMVGWLLFAAGVWIRRK